MPINRRLEVFCFILVGAILLAGTASYIIFNRVSYLISEKCGPSFPEFKVALKDAHLESDGSYSSSQLGLRFPPETFWNADGVIFGCPCAVKPCIRKCCPDGEEYYEISPESSHVCRKTNTSLFRPLQRKVYLNLNDSQTVRDLQETSVEEDHFFVLYGDVCKAKFMKDDDEDVLMEDGRILNLGDHPNYLDQAQYCLDSVNTMPVVYTLECFDEDAIEAEALKQKGDRWVMHLKTVGILVSVPFLLVTLVAYALVPQKQNLHRKWLLSHVASLIVAYSGLSIIQIATNLVHTRVFCWGCALTVQFSFLACFFWLNAMCFDIWWAFSGMRPLRGSMHETERKKLLMYSLYGWGGPFTITAVSAFMDLAPSVPHHFIKPGFGLDRCWFHGFEAHLVYFYLPISLLLSLNMMMFATTSWRLRQHKKDCKMLKNNDSKRHTADKKRFNIYLKLFVLMGITWVMEVFSFFFGGSDYIWILSDLGNCLQGPIIFVMFVCKRKMLYSLNKKLCPRLKLVQPPCDTSNSTTISRMNSNNGSCMARTHVTTQQ